MMFVNRLIHTEIQSMSLSRCLNGKLIQCNAYYYRCDAAYGLKYCCLRYFNACGADESGDIGEDHSPESHLIPIVLQVPRGKREKVFIFGNDYQTPDGTCVRDYVHVTDLATAHIKVINGILSQ